MLCAANCKQFRDSVIVLSIDSICCMSFMEQIELLSRSMFNIYLWLYIGAAILITAGGAYKMYGQGQTWGAILFLIGAIFLFALYGIRWFGAKNSIFSSTPVLWPPTINTCPDYLTYYERILPNQTKQKTCIDLIGVSTNGTLKPFPKSDSIPPSDMGYFFDLTTTTTDPKQRNNELCQRALAAGLTWEGITNGESCINPDGTISGSDAETNSKACVPTPSIF